MSLVDKDAKNCFMVDKVTEYRLTKYDTDPTIEAILVNENSPTITWENVDIIRSLGKGSFATVYEVSLKGLDKPMRFNTSVSQIGKPLYDSDEEPSSSEEESDDDDDESVTFAQDDDIATQTYALKCLDARSIESSNDLLLGVRDLLQEAAILTSLDHEHIVRVFGVSSTLPSIAYSQRTMGSFFIMEVLSETLVERLSSWRTLAGVSEKSSKLKPMKRSSSMDSILKKPKKRSDTSGNWDDLLYRLRTVVVSIVKGMEYLHSQEVLLLDLKPENVGFDRLGHVKLFDFGLAQRVTPNRRREIVGSYRYMSPEMMSGQCRGYPSDIYSFGITLWEILSLRTPFSKVRGLAAFKDDVREKHARPSMSSIPKGNKDLSRLIEACWHKDYRARPPFSEIHNIITNILLEEKTKKALSLSKQKRSAPSRSGSYGATRPNLEERKSNHQSNRLSLMSMAMSLSSHSRRSNHSIRNSSNHSVLSAPMLATSDEAAIVAAASQIPDSTIDNKEFDRIKPRRKSSFSLSLSNHSGRSRRRSGSFSSSISKRNASSHEVPSTNSLEQSSSASPQPPPPPPPPSHDPDDEKHNSLSPASTTPRLRRQLKRNKSWTFMKGGSNHDDKEREAPKRTSSYSLSLMRKKSTEVKRRGSSSSMEKNIEASNNKDSSRAFTPPSTSSRKKPPKRTGSFGGRFKSQSPISRRSKQRNNNIHHSEHAMRTSVWSSDCDDDSDDEF